jgi:membrane protein
MTPPRPGPRGRPGVAPEALREHAGEHAAEDQVGGRHDQHARPQQIDDGVINGLGGCGLHRVRPLALDELDLVARGTPLAALSWRMTRHADETASANPDATRPPGRRSRDVRAALRRTRHALKRDNLTLLAGGVAFYAFLSIFPALTAVVSIYGLFADPAQVEQQVQAMAGVLPEEARAVIGDQLGRITATSTGALGWTAVLGIVLTLWSANKATKGLFRALSIVYNEPERRGFFQLNGQSLLMTIALIVVAVVALGLVAVFPAVIGFLGLGAGGARATSLARWPLLIGVVLLALAALYTFAPGRQRPRWRWATPGALVATALWLIASIGFSLYVQYFGSFNETYGVLGAVVILMLWLYLSAFVVLIGGELNAELEHQPARDTANGELAPRGQRGAYVGDPSPA